MIRRFFSQATMKFFGQPRAGRHASTSDDGDTRPPDLTEVALAECIC
jgi:hypothetical protein